MNIIPRDPTENPYLEVNLTCIKTFLQSQYDVEDEYVPELMENVYEAIGTDLERATRKYKNFNGILVVRFYFLESVKPEYSIDHNFTLNVRVKNGSFTTFIVQSIVKGTDNIVTPDHLEHFQKYAFGE